MENPARPAVRIGAATLAELAARLGRPFEGEPGLRIEGVAALEHAGPGDIAFARSARHAAAVARSRASALILPPEMDAGGRAVIRSPNPALDFARVVERLRPPPAAGGPGDARAFLAPDACVDPSATLSPGVVVGARSRVGARSLLQPRVVLYPDVEVGADCVLHAGVVLREGTSVGDRVVLQPGVVIGSDGFGYVADEEGRPHHMPHVGRVVIEDDVEIGANTTVDRATLHETRIRRGAKIDNLVQIAHNCEIGEDAIVVAQSGLSGSTTLGAGAVVMAQAGSAGHLRIGDGAFVGPRAGLHRDVADGARVYGAPQLEQSVWRRAMAALPRLPDALRRLRALERERLARGADREETVVGAEHEESPRARSDPPQAKR